ncbi:MAG: hypothetical protein ACI9UA_002561 [Pseudoalteromonas tetraodonis]|jgi:hypothetical protein
MKIGSTILALCVFLTAPLAVAQQAKDLTKSLPAEGKLDDKGKPLGEGWSSLIAKLDGWNAEKQYWTLVDGILHGEKDGGKLHDHAWTEKEYGDFELHAVIKMSGKGANSGVCIRLKPTNADNAPGYQVDMGPGYWGCLWEERKSGMVQKFPKDLADKLVKANDWNHYYIKANGHHIEAWLNGVKTIDIVHKEGHAKGSIGFQLCHGKKNTIVDVKTLLIRETE